jgi:hypothetical protein
MKSFFQDFNACFSDLGCHLAHSPACACMHIDAEGASSLAMMFVGVLTLLFPVVGLPMIAVGIWKLVRWSGFFVACHRHRECTLAGSPGLVSLSFTIGRRHGY